MFKCISFLSLLAVTFMATACSKGPPKAEDVQPIISEPLWAYAFSTPIDLEAERREFFLITGRLKGSGAIDADVLRTVDGSLEEFSHRQIKDPRNLVDWFPGDHPEMPEIVRKGPKNLPDNMRWSCGYCHLPNGRGRPENSSLAGLPEDYFIQQLVDMKNGLRKSHDPRKPSTLTMIGLAEAMSDEEMAEVAAYYSSIPYVSQIKVVETDTIPKVRLHEGAMYLIEDENSEEDLGDRIVEAPIDAHQTNYLRNPRAGWYAFVPIGSVERGRELVEREDATGFSCASCHGEDLMGLGINPGLAGRSPSYLMRQMYNFKMKSRAGELASLMEPVVENLSVDEMTDIVAYLASAGPKEPQYITQPAAGVE